MNNGYCELSSLVGVSLKRTVLLKIESLNVKMKRMNLTYFNSILPFVYPRFRRLCILTHRHQPFFIYMCYN